MAAAAAKQCTAYVHIGFAANGSEIMQQATFPGMQKCVGTNPVGAGEKNREAVASCMFCFAALSGEIKHPIKVYAHDFF